MDYPVEWNGWTSSQTGTIKPNTVARPVIVSAFVKFLYSYFVFHWSGFDKRSSRCRVED
jgi:hypothetical protein